MLEPSEQNGVHVVRSVRGSGGSWHPVVPVQLPEPSTPANPLLKQSSAAMHCGIVFVEGPPTHALLQSANSVAMLEPVQSAASPLTMQLRAAAVSWRASCRADCLCTLTHMASMAEAASLGGRDVGHAALGSFVMHSPQIVSEPPPAAITAAVMSRLHSLLGSSSACVPQNPGVRQISTAQAGSGAWSQPESGLQVSIVHGSPSSH